MVMLVLYTVQCTGTGQYQAFTSKWEVSLQNLPFRFQSLSQVEVNLSHSLLKGPSRRKKVYSGVGGTGCIIH